MAWSYVGRLGMNSEAPPIVEYTAGTGGTTKGMPVVFSSGTVITKTGGTDTVDVFGVPIGTVVATKKIGVILGLPDVVFEIAKKAATTVTIGGKYGLEATTLDIDGANTTQTMVLVIGQGSTSTTYKCVVLDFANA